MTKTQFLLLFLSSIPFLQSVTLIVVRNHQAIRKIVSIALPLFFLINYYNLLDSYLNHDKNSLTLLSMTRDLTIGFFIEPFALIFLGLIAILWPLIVVYSAKYFALNKEDDCSFEAFLSLVIGFVSLAILSKNLISLLLFYQVLIFCLYVLSSYFIRKKDIEISHNTTLISLISLFFFFLASVLTYKIMSEINFSRGGIVNENFSNFEFILLISLFLIGIALIVLAPIYLTYGNLYYLSPPLLITLFIIPYAVLIPLSLAKIAIYIFGNEIFNSYINNSKIGIFISLIFAANLLISAILAITGANLKKMLIYLFFNQLIFTVFSIFALRLGLDKISFSIIALVLSQILIFFCVGNINLHLLNSEDKSVNGIFYDLKITISLLIFALINLVGIAPGIGIFAKYYPLKQAITHFDFINCLIIIGNSALNAFCALKIVYPMFDRNKPNAEENQEQKVEEAGSQEQFSLKVESNFRLMLPIILTASLIFFGFIFGAAILNFSKTVL